MMERATIGPLIINSPYEEPEKNWSYHRERRTFSLADGRRPAGYVIASEGSRSFDDPGHFRRNSSGQPDSSARAGVA